MMATYDRSDQTPEWRARLRRTMEGGRRKLLHDFRNTLTELCFAARLDEGRLETYYAGELMRLYEEALR
jgi:hypothetical protein